jgi:DNA-binding transcriptional ArsR family regulator
MVNKRTRETNNEIFERQARICKAFAHPGRLQILDQLGGGEKGISDLQSALGISKTGMSQHIAILMPEVKQACQLIRKVLHAQITGSHRLIQ